MRIERKIPSINQAYKTTKKGGFYKTKEVKDFQLHIAYTLRSHMIVDPPVFQKEKVKLIIEIGYKRKGRDIDAPIKFIMDALEGLLYKNDSQVHELKIKKVEGKVDYIEIFWNRL